MRSVALVVVGLVVGLGVRWFVFAERGSPDRRDVEQAVLESGLGTPRSARCARLEGADRVWTCTAQFPDEEPHDYRVVARGHDDMTITPVE
jgi:hypothetical protein